MKTTRSLIALLSVAATIAVTTDASAGTRHSRGRSRPIFSSGGTYSFRSATVTPQWTTASETIASTSSNSGACVCAPCCRPVAACVTSNLPPVVASAK